MVHQWSINLPLSRENQFLAGGMHCHCGEVGNSGAFDYSNTYSINLSFYFQTKIGTQIVLGGCLDIGASECFFFLYNYTLNSP